MPSKKVAFEDTVKTILMIYMARYLEDTYCKALGVKEGQT